MGDCFHPNFRDLKLSVWYLSFASLDSVLSLHHPKLCTRGWTKWTTLWAPLPSDFLGVGLLVIRRVRRVKSGIYYPMQLLLQSKIILFSKQSSSHNSSYSLTLSFTQRYGNGALLLASVSVLSFVVFQHPAHCFECCIFIKLSLNGPIWDVICFLPIPCPIHWDTERLGW